MTEGSAPTAHEAFAEEARQLRLTHLFGGIDGDDLRALAARCEPLSLAAGNLLMRQGDPADRFFVVLSGHLQVTQRGANGEDILLGEVRKGEHVGEAALRGEAPRMATVQAITESRLLGLSREALDGFLATHPTVRESLVGTLEYHERWAATRRFRPEPSTVLRTLSELVEGLGAEALQLLETEVEWVTLPRGATLMRQGDPADCLYFLVSGRLRIYGHRDDGEEVDMNEVGPGESVGEMALLSREPRSASASALRDSELLRLSKRGFDQLLARHPEAMAVFTRVVVDRLHRRTRARAAMAQLRCAPLATVEACEEIVRTENLVLRNLRITQMYHRLSLELTLLLGHEDANWCTFACNASKTAGYSIRREELPFYRIISRLGRRPGARKALDRIEAAVVDAGMTRRFAAILAAVSNSISAGNLKVFAELGPVFARFVRTFRDDAEYDSERLGAFLATLHPGSTEAGGQELLREALSHYYEAMFEPRPKRKTELILLGNIKVGLHEQMRLQPNIFEALTAPLRFGLEGLLSDRILRVAPTLLPSRADAFVRTRLVGAEQRLAERFATNFRRLVTRRMMTLRLPYGEVRLGADMPRLPNEELFPDMLQEIELHELQRIIQEFDGSKRFTRNRASDWGDLRDRMTFIVVLFRSRQRSLELFGQPFQLDQRAEMDANRVPRGRL